VKSRLEMGNECVLPARIVAQARADASARSTLAWEDLIDSYYVFGRPNCITSDDLMLTVIDNFPERRHVFRPAHIPRLTFEIVVRVHSIIGNEFVRGEGHTERLNLRG